MRAGERAALVAEERALDQLVRDRRQVDGDERRVGAARLPVQQPREQLLAGAALAEDQHRRRQLGDLVHQLDDLAHLLARPDEELALALLGDLRAQRDHLPVEILPLAGIAHERPQLVVVEVLGDVVIRAVLHRLHGGLDLVDGRDHDALDQAVVLLDDAQDVEAADARQADVEQHHIDVLLAEQRQGGLAARDREDPVVALAGWRRACPACPDRRRRSGRSWRAGMNLRHCIRGARRGTAVRDVIAVGGDVTAVRGPTRSD